MLKRFETRNNNSTPTSKLQHGWYRTHLQHLVDSNLLTKFPPTHDFSVLEMEDRFPADFLHSNKPQLDYLAQVTENDVVIMKLPFPIERDHLDVMDRSGGSRSIELSTLNGFPFDQMTAGIMFLKDSVKLFTCGCYVHEKVGPCFECVQSLLPLPVYRFPQLNVQLPESHQVIGQLGVMTCSDAVPPSLHKTLNDELHRLGSTRTESPAPMYHNIIDPNVGTANKMWVPVDLQVSKVSSVAVLNIVQEYTKKALKTELPTDVIEIIRRRIHSSSSLIDVTLCSEIPDVSATAYPKLYAGLQHLLNIAMPFVAKLKRPSLLLPGPLQAVVKAQRIVLAEGERYEGVWHEDGLREHVIATVLYYYKKAAHLKGGGIEFASKEPFPMGCGDYSGPYDVDTDDNATRKAARDFSRCIAHVSEGTLLVFNNYACVHRVLPMVAEGDSGSRDFIAFFIIDQQNPLQIPAKLSPRADRLVQRNEMLKEQLCTVGHFGFSEDDIYTTGNGAYVDLKWIQSSRIISTSFLDFDDDLDCSPHVTVASMLNMPPPVLDRGWSFLNESETPQFHFDPTSPIELHRLGKDGHFLDVFVDKDRYMYFQEIPKRRKRMATRSSPEETFPEKGVRAIQHFDDIEEWLSLGLYTIEPDLKKQVSGLLNGSE